MLQRQLRVHLPVDLLETPKKVIGSLLKHDLPTVLYLVQGQAALGDSTHKVRSQVRKLKLPVQILNQVNNVGARDARPLHQLTLTVQMVVFLRVPDSLRMIHLVHVGAAKLDGGLSLLG